MHGFRKNVKKKKQYVYPILLIKQSFYAQILKTATKRSGFFGCTNFLHRRDLFLRTRTRVSHITNTAMQPVKRDFCRRHMTSFKSRIINPK